MDHLQFLLLGLGNGAVFAAIGLALVLTFRSSGVVNFAAGATALYAAYTYVFLREGRLLNPIPGTPVFIDLGSPLGVGPAMALAIAVTTCFSLASYVLVFRPLRHAPPVASAVASLGSMVLLQAVLAQRIGTRPISVAPIFPTSTADLGSAVIRLDRVWFAGTMLVLGGLLAAVFRWTQFGLATRAAAQTEKGAIVTGLAPDRIAAANWAIAGAITGLSGILIAPMVPLVPVSYTLFVIPALAAALVGQFRAIAPTVAGALVLGMLQSEATYLQTRLDWMPSWVVPRSGLPELLPLGLVVGLLVLRTRPLVSRGLELREGLRAAPRPRSVLAPAMAALAAGIAAIVAFDSAWRVSLITSLILGVVALGLVVVTGYGGQVSLAQLTLSGVGGFLLSTLGDDWGVPFPVAPLLAALGATVVGVLFGLPALRLRGLGLGVVTLALAAALEAAWFRNNDFNGGPASARIRDPSLFGIDLGIGEGLEYPREAFAMVCLVVLVASGVGVALLRRSRLGAAAMAVRVNERAAAAAGIDVVRVKLALFAIGAFLAGLGGGLLAYRQRVATFELYTTLAGLGLFATVYLAGITSVSGAVLAGLLGAGGLAFRAVETWGELGDWYPATTALLLVVSVIAFPDGLVGPLHRWSTSRRRSPPARARAASPSPPPDRTGAPLEIPTGTPVLDVVDVTVAYGNVVALEAVTFEVTSGTIVGLIGPNGAGKTTLLDALTGFASGTGTVSCGAIDLTSARPHQRARAGLARTFQATQLCEDLSVTENVAIGLAAGGGAATVADALSVLGLVEVADTPVAALSQGTRQLVAVARSLAGDPTVLLLDEPAGGLDAIESRWLGARLRAVRDRGTTIVLVDHDMGLVLELCDRILVLDVGRLIFDGPPALARQDPTVARAYLGRTGAVS